MHLLFNITLYCHHSASSQYSSFTICHQTQALNAELFFSQWAWGPDFLPDYSVKSEDIIRGDRRQRDVAHWFRFPVITRFFSYNCFH